MPAETVYNEGEGTINQKITFFNEMLQIMSILDLAVHIHLLLCAVLPSLILS